MTATVWIVTDVSKGTGVIVSKPDGTLVVATAQHVVQDSKEIHCYFPQFSDSGVIISDKEYYLNPGTSGGILATLLKGDRRRDLALLKLESIPDNVKPICLASTVRPGEEVHIVGNSGVGPLFGYAFGHVRGVFTAGTQSDTHISDSVFRSSDVASFFEGPIRGQYIVCDAPVNEGDSGGPAVRAGSNGEPELVGLAQSYGSGRLISNLVHSAELAAILSEGPRRPDLRVLEMLDELSLEYEINEGERYAVACNSTIVFVESLAPDANTREIWAPVADVNDYLSQEFTETLLESNSRLRLGRYEIRKSDDSSVAAFAIEIPVDASTSQLREAIEFAAAAASKMRPRKLQLPDGYGIPSVIPPQLLPEVPSYRTNPEANAR